MKRVLVVLALAIAAFAQTRSRLGEYALILDDQPVARKIQSRMALSSNQAHAQFQKIQQAQSAVMAELRGRKIRVTGSTQVLLNAVLVAASREDVAQLRQITGVKYVLPAPHAHPDLDRAVSLMNVPAAWSALGGASNAGAGIKIGIIDSGIDQNHPGFQDPSLTPPAGFPKGDTNYTNNKVIVARSYVQSDLAPGFTSDPSTPLANISLPDDYTPRDHMGHGTAIAMIAAGAQNTGPAATIQGVAPKAFLGNYKVFGSPGINDFTSFAAVHDALADALADGMDVVTLSMSEGDSATGYGPLDNLPECGGSCDVYSMAVENAVASGMVVVVSAGNDGNLGLRPRTLNTIHRPGGAPSAITVGALMNSHALYQAVKVSGSNVPANLQNIHALFDDGPQISAPLTAPIRVVGDLACSPLPAGSLAGSIALIQRGNCFFSDKINNAQNAGAAGVIIYQSAGLDNIYSSFGAQNTGIPAVMIGNTDGAALANFLAPISATVNVTLDPAFAPVDSQGSTVWPSSSRGPSYGTFASTPTTVIKPELAAIGVNVYTATQKLDPNGDNYNASGYTSVTGTSYAVPMVAGAVALVKQKHPSFTPAQLKSAVVNTATQDVTDAGATAGVNAAGAGKLSAGDAVNTAATLDPATIEFGPLTSTTVSISRNLVITNVSSASGTFNLSVQRTNDSTQLLQLGVSSITLQPGQPNNVNVRLGGNRPNPGSYEGFIVVTGGGSTLRVPYQFLVPDNVPADVFPILDGSFTGGVGDTGWGMALRVIDQYGVPPAFPPGVPVNFAVTAGGGSFTKASDCFNGVCVDNQTFMLGNAYAFLDFGSSTGPQTVTATVGNMSLEFDGFARPYPTISANGVVNAASGQVGQGLAAGSYAAIYGTALSDALQLESTAALPVSLSQVYVSFDAPGISQPGHIHFVSPGQVNVQIPWEFQGQSSVDIKVGTGALQGPVYHVPLAPVSPGIFEISGVAAAEDLKFAVIGPNHPAQRGQPLALFVNGLGPVSNPPASGAPSSGTQLSTTVNTVTVTIGGSNAPVSFAGLTPGVVGLYQINLTVPSDIAAGNQQVVVMVGGVSSKASVLPVQ